MVSVGLSSPRQHVPGAIIQITPAGAKDPSEIGTIEYVLIKNKGFKSVRSADFVEPLTVKERDRKIVAILSCPSWLTINGAAIQNRLTWERSGSHWVAENSLFNVSDTACMAIVYKDDFLDKKSLNSFQIDGKISDAKIVNYASLAAFSRSDLGLLSYFSVELSGGVLYAFLALFAVATLLVLSLLDGTLKNPVSSFKLQLVRTLLVLLSAAFSESLVFVVVSHDPYFGNPIVWPIMFVFVLIVIYFLYKIFKGKFGNLEKLPISK
ncbi:hypothetical protein PMI14_00280 [Acidovorax sp. CF316]|nr:hypothetical protein PMI14_00280 [Acidovorax sp. CF316]